MNRLLTFVKRQNNRSMLIQDPAIKERVKKITQELIGGYEPEVR